MTGGSQPAAYVELTEAAFEDLLSLAHHSPLAVRWALMKMILLERNPNAGEPLLGGLIGWRKLIVSDRQWRVVWRVRQDQHGASVIEIAEVWAVGARSEAEVYAEMDARIAALPSNPETVALADAVERLKRVASGVTAARRPVVEPLPDWLVDRLVHTVGLDRDKAEALSLEEAFEAWTDWCSTPH